LPKPLRRSAALGVGLALSLGALAPSALLVETAAAAVPSAVATTGTSDLQRHLPPHWNARRAAVAATVGIQSPVRDAVARAINPDDYDCAATDLDAFVGQLVGGLSDAQLEFLLVSGVLDFPTYDALFFGTENDPRYALREEGHDITRAFRDARRFWDVDSSDIQLLAMHGDVLTDKARLVRLLTEVFGLTEAEAVPYAAYVASTVASIPALQDGDNPIFTLNAFAFSAEGESAAFAGIPDKLIFGDGIIDALQYLGIGDVGPEAILGHEFAHHVQFELNLFETTLEGPEATRRTELMADAMGTYFVTHKRGLALNARRVLEAEKSFYEIGDCAFDNPGHHGTPKQRERASAWGAELARSQQKQGHILPAATVASRFEKVLPGIVTPDVR
jgi:hypothetical protein